MYIYVPNAVASKIGNKYRRKETDQKIKQKPLHTRKDGTLYK